MYKYLNIVINTPRITDTCFTLDLIPNKSICSIINVKNKKLVLLIVNLLCHVRIREKTISAPTLS